MVETDITKRWEQDIPHHSKSIEIYKIIEENDWKYGGDYFCWKSGGDGDNGEHLMYLLDIHFEQQDEMKKVEYEGEPRTTEELYDADPNCDHRVVGASGGGIKCTKCSGWFCY